MNNHSTYEERINAIDSFAYYNMASGISQFTIDLIEAIQDELFINRNAENGPITKDEIGAIGYDLDNILEIIDKSRETDCRAINDLKQVFSDWHKEMEAIQLN